MGYLFENAEKMDIQAERQNTKEAQKAAKAAEQKATAAQQKIQSMDHILDLTLRELIRQGKAAGQTREELLRTLQEKYSMNEVDAKVKIEKHWK